MAASTLRFIFLLGSFFKGVSSKSLAPKISGGNDSFRAVAHLTSFSSSVSSLKASPTFFFAASLMQNFWNSTFDAHSLMAPGLRTALMVSIFHFTLGESRISLSFSAVPGTAGETYWLSWVQNMGYRL